MNSDTIRQIFQEATQAQIEAILELFNNEQLVKEGLELEIEQYKEAEKARKEAEEETKARIEMNKRFDSLIGEGRQFVHEYVRDGIMAEFETALNAGDGKSDAEIFESLTKDKPVFAPMSGGDGHNTDMGLMGKDSAKADEIRSIMGLI